MLVLLGCAPGPRMTVMKSSILSHNKAHICCRLTADTHPEREFGKQIYTGSRLTTNLTSVAGQVFSRTDTFWTHKKAARPLSQCGSCHPPFTAGTIHPRWTLQPEQSGQPFWSSWQWPRPFTTLWQNSSTFHISISIEALWIFLQNLFSPCFISSC